MSQTKAAYAQLRYDALTEAHGSAQRGPRKMAGGCSLTQRAGPPGGAILRTRFWAQIPAHIWNRLPCTQQWGAGQSVPDYGLDSGLKIRSPKSDLARGVRHGFCALMTRKKEGIEGSSVSSTGSSLLKRKA